MSANNTPIKRARCLSGASTAAAKGSAAATMTMPAPTRVRAAPNSKETASAIPKTTLYGEADLDGIATED